MAKKPSAKRAVKQRMSSAKKPRGRPFAKRNPYAFKPGQSGNPAGRPKSITLSEAYRKALAQVCPEDPEGRTFAEVIAARLVAEAAAGEVSSAREIADRTEGKPRQALDIDMMLLDWRELAKAHGLDEGEVIAEAYALIQSASTASGEESY